VNYFKAAELAPRGADSFAFSDLWQLPQPVREQALAEVPEVEREAALGGDEQARRRVVRALFWPLVYHLAPRRWDALSRAEPIHPGVLAALPADGCRVMEIGAGSGRLTAHLMIRAAEVVAIEPAAPLRELFRARLPSVTVLPGEAARIPLPDHWAGLSVACAALAPDAECLKEIERCTQPSGTIAFISPEEPEWLESRGFRRLRFDAREVAIPDHDPGIEEFFGELDPPHEILLRLAGNPR
jgi:SAM-dependent methyltransferase